MMICALVYELFGHADIQQNIYICETTTQRHQNSQVE